MTLFWIWNVVILNVLGNVSANACGSVNEMMDFEK